MKELIWGKDAGGEEEEIWERLLELNRYFHKSLCKQELFRTAKVNGKSYKHTNERIRFDLGLDGSGGVFQRTAFAEIQGSGRQDPLT